MNEQRRGSGRSQCRGDLAGDMAGLPHPRHDNPAGNRDQTVDGHAELITQAKRQCRQARSLGVQNVARDIKIGHPNRMSFDKGKGAIQDGGNFR